MAQSYSNDFRERIAALVLGGNVPGGGGAAFRASGAQYGQRGREGAAAFAGGSRPQPTLFGCGGNWASPIPTSTPSKCDGSQRQKEAEE